MNNTSTNKNGLLFEVSTSYLMKQLAALSEVVQQSLEQEALEALQQNLKELGEIGIAFQQDLKPSDLHRLTTRMARIFKKSVENQSFTTQQYLDTVSHRLHNFLFAVQEVEDYPLNIVSSTIQQLFEQENTKTLSVKSLFKKFKKCLVNIMIKHYMFKEEATFDLIIQHELKTLKIDYLIQNPSLRYLEPHKYNAYVNCLNKGFQSLYHDMKAYTDFSNPFFEGAEKLFQHIFHKLNQAAGNQPLQERPVEATTDPNEKKTYPTHIFRTNADYELFNDLIQYTPTADTIGFVYRKMSEQENPPTIVVKETVFRNWFNQESGHKAELKNPIKTLSRIKDQANKELIYQLNKQLQQSKKVTLN